MNGGGVSRDEALLYLKSGEGWYFPHIERCGDKRTAVDTGAKASKYPLFTTIFRTIDLHFLSGYFSTPFKVWKWSGAFLGGLFFDTET